MSGVAEIDSLTMTEIEKLKVQIKEIIKEKSFKVDYDKGFTLASGINKPFYFNLKKTIMTYVGSNLIAEVLFKRLIIPYNIQAVGGLETGAIPVIQAVVTHPLNQERGIKGFYIKKQPKDYGDQNLIEGSLDETDKELTILVIDDVVTTGGSMGKAIQMLRDNGYNKIPVVTSVLQRDIPKDQVKLFEMNVNYIPILHENDFVDK
jgi:orotate phosphoribosyltransferase